MTDEDNEELGVALTYWALGFFVGTVATTMFFLIFGWTAHIESVSATE